MVRYSALLVFICCLVLDAAAQNVRNARRPNTKAIIDRLEEKSEYESGEAAKALIRTGRSVIAPLTARLRVNKHCDFQFNAIEVIRKLDPKRGLVKTVLWDLARGRCEYRHDPEKYLPDANLGSIYAQWNAARVLAADVDGGAVLVFELLDDYSGIYGFLHAFPAISAKLRGGDRELILAAKAAIPKLPKYFDHPGRRTRCDAYDVLEFFRRSPHQELRDAAEQALQGRSPECS